MKKIKITSLLVISLLICSLKVNAAMEGICFGKEEYADSGYCKLDEALQIKSTDYGTYNYLLLDPEHPYGDSGYRNAARNYFSITYNGISQKVFCIDANLSEPSAPYQFARPLDIIGTSVKDTVKGYDLAIATIYNLYVNESVVLLNSGVNENRAFMEYLQVANIAMRAVTAKYNHYLSLTNNSEPFPLMVDVYKNIAQQFEGIVNPAGTTIATKLDINHNADKVKIAQKWYCAGIVSGGKIAGLIDQKTIDFCNNLAGKVTWTPTKYTLQTKAGDISVNDKNGKFERIIPVEISGLAKFKNATYKDTNPTVKITDVVCDSSKIKKEDCTLVDKNLLKKELLDFNDPSDKITVNVIVRGNLADFSEGTKIKIKLKYEYNHVLDVNNLFVLRYSTSSQETQRMIALATFTPWEGELEISVQTPSMCKSYEDGTYSFGGTMVDFATYISNCSCEGINYNSLSDDEKESYKKVCAVGDHIHLDNTCRNEEDPEGNSMSESYVQQDPLATIMEKVVAIEEANFDNGIQFINKQLDAFKDFHTESDGVIENNAMGFDYFRDDEYMKSDNPYCRLYTSEEANMFYPGTIDATSGRFFIFKDQPRIESEIYANFHTNYARWELDYQNAIKVETAAYTAWQRELALENAIKNADYETKSCCAMYNDDGKCDEWGQYDQYTGWSDSQTWYDSTGEFDQRHRVRWVTNSTHPGAGVCPGNANPAPPQANPTAKYNAWQTKKTDRKDLEDYKKECEKYSDIAKKWGYYNEPDLTFTYDQYIYENGQNRVKRETIPLQISWEADKYWPNVSTPQEFQSVEHKGTTDMQLVLCRACGLEDVEVIRYGNKGEGESVNEEPKKFDKETDYQVGYAQTLYYKPATYYHSLIPSGKYVTSQETFKEENALDVGYVFNIEITNYRGEYSTWFSVNSIGHLKKPPTATQKGISNIQRSLNEYLERHPDKTFASEINNKENQFVNKCYYTDEEMLYERDCPTCDKDDPSTWRTAAPWEANFYTRTVALNVLQPHVRDNNWTDVKGSSAKDRIQDLNETIYNDETRENIEYEFTIGPKEMNDIKKTYGNDYYDFNLECINGKDCISPLVTEYACNENEQNCAGRDKWKYFNSTNGWETLARGVGAQNYPDDCPNDICP